MDLSIEKLLSWSSLSGGVGGGSAPSQEAILWEDSTSFYWEDDTDIQWES